MGLVASQARLMLLTSRKSDIEYQVQNINNRRLRITYQTSKLATDYSDALNNKKVVVSNSNSVSNDFDSSYITANGYIIVDRNGDPDPNAPGLDPSTLYQKLCSGELMIATGPIDRLGPAQAFNSTSFGQRVGEVLDTSDDDSATAKYESDLAPLQTQDKKLELDMKNLETQYKAITAEIDGVSKVLTDNIQKTFKIFAGQ